MNNLFETLTENELLERYKLLKHLDVVRRDCVVERDDGINLDDWLKNCLRQWYADLLLHAPIEILPVTNIASTITSNIVNNRVISTLPNNAIRPVEIQFDVWVHPVCTFLEPTEKNWFTAMNEWIGGGDNNPKIIMLQNGFVATSSSTNLILANFVVKPPDGTYIINEAILKDLPTFL